MNEHSSNGEQESEDIRQVDCLDVDDDSFVTPTDALAVINDLNSYTDSPTVSADPSTSAVDAALAAWSLETDDSGTS